MNRLSPSFGLWLCVTLLTLFGAASSANAQGTVHVTATVNGYDPAGWVPAPTDPMTPSMSFLNASVEDPPNPISGCSLNGPNWSWTIDTDEVQYSADGSSWSTASGGYSAWIVQPDPNSAAATLNTTFSEGGYWQIACNAAVAYDDGACGDKWEGNSKDSGAEALAKPKSVELLSLTVVSGASQTDVTGDTNWVAVKKAGDKVIAQAKTKPDNADGWAQIQWTGGDVVSGKANQRSVDKGTSAKTTVTAKIGPNQYSVDIWIIWATIVNQVTGTTPGNAVQFGIQYDGTENLGVQAYDDGNAARGKVIPVATVTPEGVNTVLTGGFAFKRDKWRHDFKDGAKVDGRYDNGWVPDNSDRRFQSWPKTDDVMAQLRLDETDNCYDRDAPNIDDFGQTFSYERYDNFREYLQWHGDMCADYTGWYFKAVWLKEASGKDQVLLEACDVQQGALNLNDYTTAQYPPS